MRNLLFFSFIIASSSLFAQLRLNVNQAEEFNYIPNPGFEETLTVPCYWNQGTDELSKWFKDWSSPTATTPDLLSTTVEKKCWSHPSKNNNGKQYPHGGKNMMGIKTYGKGGTDTYWHEYLQVPLLKELEQDSLYYVSFWINLSARASKASNNMGVAMLDEELDTRNRHPLYITPVINSKKIVKPRIRGWKKISGVFKATGNEKVLILGNFYGDEVTKTEKIPDGKHGAYYYIDDILLRKARPNEKETEKPDESLPPPPPKVVEGRIESDEVMIDEVVYEVGTTIELNNIFFEFDKADLLPESTQELTRLRDLLFDYPYMEIEIVGHTDNKGSDDYNLKLSESRAQAVYEFLIENDIDSTRIEYMGKGSRKPVASNETEEGRDKNRRVEFKIISQ